MNDEYKMKWIGYLCEDCGTAVNHHGHWDIFCPKCGQRIIVSEATKIEEVEAFSKDNRNKI